MFPGLNKVSSIDFPPSSPPKLRSRNSRKQEDTNNFQIKSIFKFPTGIIQTYRIICKHFWFPTRLEFSSDGTLTYNDPRKYPKVFLSEFFEFTVFFLSCLAAFYIHFQRRYNPKNPAYWSLTWLHVFFHRGTIFVAITATLIARLLRKHAKDLELGFNALVNYKRRLDSGKLST